MGAVANGNGRSLRRSDIKVDMHCRAKCGGIAGNIGSGSGECMVAFCCDGHVGRPVAVVVNSDCFDQGAIVIEVDGIAFISGSLDGPVICVCAVAVEQAMGAVANSNGRSLR